MINPTFDIQLSRPADFNSLVLQIQQATEVLQENARMVINRDVTARAWLTGFYIVEYEQNGHDRAQYGEQLLKRLSERLKGKSFGITSLKNYRLFYLMYPQLAHPLTQYLITQSQKSQSVFDFLMVDSENEKEQMQLVESKGITGQTEKGQTVFGFSNDGFAMRLHDGSVEPVPQMLFDRMPYSHFTLLIRLDNPLKRAFYAIEAMRGPWSVRELQRQIDSNYFERSGWSKHPEQLANKLIGKVERASLVNDIKSPYVYEFLGLASKDAVEEGNLENAIIKHFEEFIMELGMGFCLEARQKKLLIDNNYRKADLVFYHRILKCHVIVELKAKALEFGDVMQLNLYLEYYRRHYMQPDDNPPMGLLLCTEYGKEMVDYLTPFIDPELFIAKYELQLPSKEKLQHFLMRENTSNNL